MQPQKPMQKAELDLLAVIVRLHLTRGPINRDVLSVEVEFPGSTEVFPEGQGGVTGLIGPGDFPLDRHDSAIG